MERMSLTFSCPLPLRSSPAKRPIRVGFRLMLNFYESVIHPPGCAGNPRSDASPGVGSLAVSGHQTGSSSPSLFWPAGSWCGAGGPPWGGKLWPLSTTGRLSWGCGFRGPHPGLGERENFTQYPAQARVGAAQRTCPAPPSNASPSPDPDGTQRPSHSPRLAKLRWPRKGGAPKGPGAEATPL